MTIKSKDLERKVVTKVENIDLSDLYVSRVLNGKKRVSRVPMTVKDFIEYLSSYSMDGIVDYNQCYCDNCDGCGKLTVTITRQETDDEYAERIANLKRLEETKKDKAKQQRTLNKKRELDTLKRLAKKYKIDINKDLPEL